MHKYSVQSAVLLLNISGGETHEVEKKIFTGSGSTISYYFWAWSHTTGSACPKPMSCHWREHFLPWLCTPVFCSSPYWILFSLSTLSGGWACWFVLPYSWWNIEVFWGGAKIDKRGFGLQNASTCGSTGLRWFKWIMKMCLAWRKKDRCF